MSGVLYGQSALLPGLLTGRRGLTPQGLGLVFAGVALCHVAGSVSARFWIGRITPQRLVLLAGGGVLTACALLVATALAVPTVAGLIGPVALAAFSGSHSYPILVSASVEGFARDAGAASALLGCLQVGAGFLVATLGGMAVEPAFGAPLALATSLTVAGTLTLGLALTAPHKLQGGEP